MGEIRLQKHIPPSERRGCGARSCRLKGHTSLRKGIAVPIALKMLIIIALYKHLARLGDGILDGCGALGHHFNRHSIKKNTEGLNVRTLDGSAKEERTPSAQFTPYSIHEKQKPHISWPSQSALTGGASETALLLHARQHTLV